MPLKKLALPSNIGNQNRKDRYFLNILFKCLIFNLVLYFLKVLNAVKSADFLPDDLRELG